ncbi:MAG TPA: hypothetical protein VKQ30_13350 [Ktedonobacterales bacterium]|nr:hypothetical protein [Ktedonobacterales bacterium]
MRSVHFPFNLATGVCWLAASQAAAFARILVLLAILLAFAAGGSSAVTPLSAHAQLAMGPQVQCPGISLPC